MKKLISILLLGLVSGCSQQGSHEYVAALSQLIRQSDRIVVTEHSFDFDAFDVDAGKSLIPNAVVYRTVELNETQRKMFLATVEGLDPKTQDAFSACIFEPHHTFRFYAKGQLRSTMEICFKCSQILWDATQALPPWSIYGGLSSVVSNLGLESERDWSTLAQEHLKRSNNVFKADVAKATQP